MVPLRASADAVDLKKHGHDCPEKHELGDKVNFFCSNWRSNKGDGSLEWECVSICWSFYLTVCFCLNRSVAGLKDEITPKRMKSGSYGFPLFLMGR